MSTDFRPSSDTSLTLMMRVQKAPADSKAWEEFVQHYRPMIQDWCRKWGLQDSDAEDVTQEVLLKFLTVIKQFRYDPDQSFRSWLKTVTHRALTDFARARQRIASRERGQVDLLTQSSDALAQL